MNCDALKILAEILDDEQNLQILSLLQRHSPIKARFDIPINKMSYFERFSLACDNFEFLSANRLKKSVCSLLSDNDMSEYLHDITSYQTQKEVWQGLAGIDVQPPIMRYPTDFSAKQRSDTASDALALCKSLQARASAGSAQERISLSEILNGLCRRNATERGESIDEILYSIKDSLAQRATHGTTLYADIRRLSRVRPDKYHAEAALKKLRAGDICPPEELSVLQLWTIYRFAVICAAQIDLHADADAALLREIVQTLTLRAPAVRINLVFDPSEIEMARLATEICLEATEKNVCPKLIPGQTEAPQDSYLAGVAYVASSIPEVCISFAEIPEC